MSKVIHFMFVIFLSLMVTSSYPVSNQTTVENVSNQTTVENKTAEFYCVSIKLKDIINDLIEVISLCSKYVFE